MAGSERELTSFENFWNFMFDPAKLIEFMESSSILSNLHIFDPVGIGFDHDKVLNRLLNIKVKNNIDDLTFLTEMRDCVCIGLKRGSISRVQMAGNKKIVDLMTRYKIKIGESNGKKLERHEITFFRIIAVFPMIASTMIKYFPSYYLNNQLGKLYGTNFLPNVLRHSGAAGMIPTGKIGELYLNLHVAYMMELSLIINPNARDMEPHELYQKQRRYSMAGWTSELTDNETRVKYFKSLGLEDVGVFKEVICGLNILMEVIGEEVRYTFEDFAEHCDDGVVFFISKEVDSNIKGTCFGEGGDEGARRTKEDCLKALVTFNCFSF